MSDWNNVSRRSFVKGLASAGILSATSPLFNELMAHAAGPAPVRALFVVIHHGWGMGRGERAPVSDFGGTETNYTLPTVMTPFEAIKDQCLFVDGLRGTFWDNAHDTSYTDVLTAGVPAGATGGNFPLEKAFPRSLYPSIDALLEAHSNKPALRFSASYSTFGVAFHPICIGQNLQKLGMQTRALDAYNQNFKPLENGGGGGGGQTGGDKVTPRVLAGISDTTNELLGKVQGSARQQLSNYIDAFTAFRASLVVPGGGTVAGGAKVEIIPGSNQALEKEVDCFLDMVRVGFVNDTHRVAVLGIGEPQANISFAAANGEQTSLVAEQQRSRTDFHHAIAHYNGGQAGPDHSVANTKLGYAASRRMYCEKIVAFVNKLKNTIDVDGKPVIDNTVIVLTGEVSTGEHDTTNKTHVVIGGGGGAIRRNRWMRMPTQNAGATVAHANTSGGAASRAVPSYMGRAGAHSHADLLLAIAKMSGMTINTVGIPALNKGALDLG